MRKKSQTGRAETEKKTAWEAIEHTEKEQVTKMIRICKECGKEFELRGREIGFCKKRNLALPTTCPECREKSRAQAAKQAFEQEEQK